MKKTELIVLGLAGVAVWMILKASTGTTRQTGMVRAGGSTGGVNPSDNPNWDPTKVYF